MSEARGWGIDTKTTITLIEELIDGKDLVQVSGVVHLNDYRHFSISKSKYWFGLFFFFSFPPKKDTLSVSPLSNNAV